jgi:uncharacterized protein YjiS (DUF1127 family)
MSAGRLRLRQSDLPGVCNAVARVFRRGIAWDVVCTRRQKERRQLSEMEARLLKNIGVSRFDAIRQANKPLWR